MSLPMCVRFVHAIFGCVCVQKNNTKEWDACKPDRQISKVDTTGGMFLGNSVCCGYASHLRRKCTRIFVTSNAKIRIVPVNSVTIDSGRPVCKHAVDDYFLFYYFIHLLRSRINGTGISTDDWHERPGLRARAYSNAKKIHRSILFRSARDNGDFF